LDRSQVLSILTGEVIDMPDSLFDRAAFIEKVRQVFKPLEVLLGEGNAFDYDEAAIFSGVINGSQEHVVSVPLTKASVSLNVATHLGEQDSWVQAGKLPLFGFYMMPPTDCIKTLDPDTPYLVRGVSWDQAEVVDAGERLVRHFTTWWHRGKPKPAYYRFSGNYEIHLETCTTASSNQV
jgi:hypothetical protein